jgi:hypothetical protein
MVCREVQGKGAFPANDGWQGRDGSARSFSCAQWERKMTISGVAKIATILDVSKAEILVRINTEEDERVLSAKQKENTGPVRVSKHPGFGFMKGLIKIEEGFDITGPYSDEPWDEGYVGDDRSK